MVINVKDSSTEKHNGSPSPSSIPSSNASVGASGDRSVAVGNDITGVVQTGDGAQATILQLEALPTPDSVDARPGLSNVPIRTDLFVGRAAELKRLDAALGRGQAVIQAVHGLGGIGKSTLAARWAATRGHGYYPIRWIIAESPLDVRRGLAELATDLEPALSALLSTEAQAQWALQWLASHTGWLLVMDNVDKLSDIETLLARAPGGKFLITSRSASGWREIPTVPLDVLEEDEAIDLFNRIVSSTGADYLNGASELCGELGYLPLAIEQAAAYLVQNPLISPHAYLQLLSQYPTSMFRKGAEDTNEGRTIARIWHVTLEKVSAKQPLAMDLLRALAWYAPDAIPDAVPSALLDGFADPPEIHEAIGLLIAYSMISADPSTRTYSVHRLVQSFLRSPDPNDPHRAPDLIDKARDLATHLHSVVPDDSEGSSSREIWAGLIPHIDHLFEESVPSKIDALTVLESTGVHLLREGKFSQAVDYLERALSGAIQQLGEEHPWTLTYRHNLASAYQDVHDFRQAIPLYERTLEKREMLLGKDDPETVTTRSNLACSYAQSGDTAQAIPILHQVLEQREQTLGNLHRDTIEARHNLACTYRDAGDQAKAISLFEEVLREANEVLGEDDSHTLTYLHNLATEYSATENLDKAVPMLERALEVNMRMYGEDNHKTLLSKNSLAGAYESIGRQEEAIALWKESLDTAVRLLGEEHPHTRIIRGNLAFAYESEDCTLQDAAQAQTQTDEVSRLPQDEGTSSP
ncbi:tetratricopeptide repeat protein [Streptomyces bluensis]|uniref:tetratricopeptide repeat protein n=1 Tax=Streptomyces bluensis TaxID=33897 RepID=UPI00331AC3AF